MHTGRNYIVFMLGHIPVKSNLRAIQQKGKVCVYERTMIQPYKMQ